MPHLTIELILWVLLAFFIGCIIGCLLRKMFGSNAAASDSASTAASGGASASAADDGPASVDAEAPEKGAGASAAPMPAAATAVGSGKPSRPAGLAAARDGKADNLQIISGVGPKLEKTLQKLGFYHFDQIAVWSRDEVDWVDEHLRFKGRIDRDEWIAQCRLLADGDMDQFEELYGSGGLKDASGKTRSGSRTRKSKKT